ncbi:hypothetical protein PSTG_13160 [Puccinia striiformis f. sp. tritici PST-78]|uniref:Uncharacterized protein n=1 Tax=Puccinia striiformis f. sp. tritici PST-78 TaxID=1165861 RepID=A0A0L0V2B3_9BASI|nr:hypothetical protein PSTG_13160 [Puccinia striiformis f. sp. tritici PST-78]
MLPEQTPVASHTDWPVRVTCEMNFEKREEAPKLLDYCQNSKMCFRALHGFSQGNPGHSWGHWDYFTPPNHNSAWGSHQLGWLPEANK